MTRRIAGVVLALITALLAGAQEEIARLARLVNGLLAAALSDTPGGGRTVTIDLPLAPSQRSSRRPGALSSGGSRDINRF